MDDRPSGHSSLSIAVKLNEATGFGAVDELALSFFSVNDLSGFPSRAWRFSIAHSHHFFHSGGGAR